MALWWLKFNVHIIVESLYHILALTDHLINKFCVLIKYINSCKLGIHSVAFPNIYSYVEVKELSFLFKILEQGINEKIVSLDFQNYYTQILTADAQFSYKDGVIVLVTGCITGNNKVKRKFTQSFFLAPQDNGYFVLNDVFRYIDDETSNDADGSSQAPPFTPSIGMFFKRILIFVLLILFPHSK